MVFEGRLAVDLNFIMECAKMGVCGSNSNKREYKDGWMDGWIEGKYF